MDTAVCAHCKEDVVPEPPKAIWRVVNVAFWASMLAVGTVFGLVLPLNIFLVPLWVAMAGSVGVSAGRARTWNCPECHAEMFPTPEMERAIRASRRLGTHGGRRVPAHFIPRHA